MLDLISRGLSDRQIATSLGLSYETARTYVKTVRRKLGSEALAFDPPHMVGHREKISG